MYSNSKPNTHIQKTFRCDFNATFMTENNNVNACACDEVLRRQRLDNSTPCVLHARQAVTETIARFWSD